MASVNEKMNGSGYTFTLKHVGTDRSKQEGTDDDWCTLAPGAATLTHSFVGTGAAEGFTCSSSLPITVVRPGVKVDIDNENHWGGDYFTDNYQTPRSRALRDLTGPYIGKVLFVNDIDKDGSGTPDFMDGWGCLTTQIPLLEREKAGSSHRTQNTYNRFVPMTVSLEGIPPEFDTANIRLCFDYPDSPPSTMMVSNGTWRVEAVGNTTNKTFSKVTSPTGYIRIWKKDGDAARSVATDYVRSNQTVVTYYDLQSLSVPGRLYLEAVNPCTEWSGVRIMASLSLDSGSTWMASNAVRVTSMRCNFTVGVVRQFYQDGYFGGRVAMTPNYATPAGYLRYVADCNIKHEKYFAVTNEVTMLKREPDDWWHEGDAILGHGFAYFQYEGPHLGSNNALYDACTTGDALQYDHKHYWGKTGSSGFTHWDYGTNGKRNEQPTLAWWDICPYTIGDKFLVIKQAYTLNPDRAAQLFDIFNDTQSSPSRYKNFGLHINTDPNVKGWGCLSNVGLAMEQNKLDVANITNCVFNANMPTTVNKSVWEIVSGTRVAFDESLIPQGKAGLHVIEGVVDAVVGETQGLAWGASKATLGANALQGKLFNALTNQFIITPVWHTNRVTRLSDITIVEGMNENLHYYDPGKFPQVYGERPRNVFNMEERK